MLDHQSVSGLLVRLPLLLRTLHPRVPRPVRSTRLRAPDLRQDRSWLGARRRGKPEQAAGSSDRNRDGDRSLPACRGKVRGHSEHSRGARALPRPRDRDHHKVGAHRAGPRSARANLRALPAHDPRLADHAFPNSGPKARPRCSNSRAPPQDGSDARTGGSPGRDQRAPYSPGDQRPPPRPRAPVPARSGLRRQVDLGGAALLGLRQSPSLPRLALRDDAREAAGIPASVRTRDGRRPALGGRAQATRCGAAQAHGTARSRFSRAWRAAAGAPRAGSLGRDGGSTLLA